MTIFGKEDPPLRLPGAHPGSGRVSRDGRTVPPISAQAGGMTAFDKEDPPLPTGARHNP
ncbi:MAG: hypothetical protein WA821_22460 [Anaerolineales bacterium]